MGHYDDQYEAEAAEANKKRMLNEHPKLLEEVKEARLNLRDAFAMNVMNGIVQNHGTPYSYNHNNSQMEYDPASAQLIVDIAYNLADEMIARRSKKVIDSLDNTELNKINNELMNEVQKLAQKGQKQDKSLKKLIELLDEYGNKLMYSSDTHAKEKMLQKIYSLRNDLKQ